MKKKLFICLFFIVLISNPITILMASRPATTIDFRSQTKKEYSVSTHSEKKTEIIYFADSIKSSIENTEILPSKPQKNGLGMIIGGVFLALLGAVFGIGLLLIFLLGFTIGSGFYFKDIYAIAGVMLGGLVTFGLGIYMISRGRERWKEYKKYKKALKKMKKEH